MARRIEKVPANGTPLSAQDDIRRNFGDLSKNVITFRWENSFFSIFCPLYFGKKPFLEVLSFGTWFFLNAFLLAPLRRPRRISFSVPNAERARRRTSAVHRKLHARKLQK